MGKGSHPIGSRTIYVLHGLQSLFQKSGAESGTVTNPSTWKGIGLGIRCTDAIDLTLKLGAWV